MLCKDKKYKIIQKIQCTNGYNYYKKLLINVFNNLKKMLLKEEIQTLMLKQHKIIINSNQKKIMKKNNLIHKSHKIQNHHKKKMMNKLKLIQNKLQISNHNNLLYVQINKMLQLMYSLIFQINIQFYFYHMLKKQ